MLQNWNKNESVLSRVYVSLKFRGDQDRPFDHEDEHWSLRSSRTEEYQIALLTDGHE